MPNECLNSLLPFGMRSSVMISAGFFINPIYYKNSERPESSIVVDLIKINLIQKVEGRRTFCSCTLS